MKGQTLRKQTEAEPLFRMLQKRWLYDHRFFICFLDFEL